MSGAPGSGKKHCDKWKAGHLFDTRPATAQSIARISVLGIVAAGERCRDQLERPAFRGNADRPFNCAGGDHEDRAQKIA